MFRKHVLAAAIILVTGIAALAQRPLTEMKGYELYSWRENGKWHYLLIPGTNREKSFEEITTNKNIKVGDAALKGELKKISRGQEVFWMSDVGMGQPSSGKTSSMKLPSRKRIKEIIEYCNKLGIKMTLR